MDNLSSNIFQSKCINIKKTKKGDKASTDNPADVICYLYKS